MIVTSAQQAKEYKKFCKGPSMKSDTTHEISWHEKALQELKRAEEEKWDGEKLQALCNHILLDMRMRFRV